MTRRLFLLTLVAFFVSAVSAQAARFTIDSLGSAGSYYRLVSGVTVTSVPNLQLHDAGGSVVYKPGSGTYGWPIPGKTATIPIVLSFAKGTANFGATASDTALTLKVTKPGLVSGTNIEFGNAAGKGTLLKQSKTTDPLASATFSFYINALEKRKVSLSTLNLGNILNGAKINSQFTVVTGNSGALAETESITNVSIVRDLTNGTNTSPVLMQQIDRGVVRDNATYGKLYISPSMVDTMDHELNAKGKDLVANMSTGLAGYLYVPNYDAKFKLTDKAIGIYTAEDASVGDTAYKNITATVTANVGVATKIHKTPGGAPKKMAPDTNAMQDFGLDSAVTILRANIAAGAKLASYNPDHLADAQYTYSLSSIVTPAGSLAEKGKPGKPKDGDVLPGNVNRIRYGQDAKLNTIILNPANSRTATDRILTNLFGVVGSEAKIVDSYYAGTGTSPAGTVQMQWRARTKDEAHALVKNASGKWVTGSLPGVGLPDPTWLTSDVVKIGGTAITADTYYVLQMTFDNRINLSFDGPTAGTIEKEWKNMYIVQLKESGNTEKWHPAEGHKGTGHFYTEAADLGGGDGVTLDDFLESAIAQGKTLNQLVGDWGVNAKTQTSWAIVRGTGIFAVVPEPTVVLMLVSATLGAMTYGWRRFSRKNELTA